MRSLQFTQSGNEEQCARNGVWGYEYQFGVESDRAESANHYYFIDKDRKRKSRRWSMRRQYTTGFKLRLEF